MKYLIHAVFAVLLPAMAVSVKGATPTTAPVTSPSASQDLLRLARESERASMRKQLADYPTLPVAKLGDVVVLGLEAGHLTVRTTLRPTTMPSQLPVSDLPGLCTITLRQVDGKAVTAGLYEPDIFLLERYRFDEPNTTISSMTVEALPQSVQLAWSTETLAGSSEGSMVEQVVATGSGANLVEPNIVLRANSQPRDGDSGETQIELKSRDFQSLCREHPAEVEQYLGPILRELRADSILPLSDTVLAWQVFFAEANPDPTLSDAVTAGVKMLDADEYTDRQAAAKSLAKLGPAVAVELSRLDRSKLSAEQITNVDALIRKFRPVSPAVAARLITDQAFLLSCLDDPDDFIARTALAHLRKVSGQLINLDLTTRGHARRAAVQKIREHLQPIGKAP
jgi:hypothetical protein